MAQLDEIYDGSNVPEGSNDFKALPAGDYKVLVIDSDYKPNKAGTGMIAQFQLEVLSDYGTGRRIFANFNLKNQNPQAEEIAKRDFDAFRVACGCGPVRDTSALHDKVLIVRLAVKHDANYGDADGNTNVIKAYKSVSGNGQANASRAESHQQTPTQAPAQAQQYREPPQAAPASRPAWNR